jgi:hypothetical protein
MGKVTSLCLLLSTVVLVVSFGKGLGVMRGGDVGTHLTWALAALVAVLGANVFAMFHAAQSDRIIRALRAELAKQQPPPA